MTDKAPHPIIEDAPGLVWKPRKRGWEARWAAPTNVVKRKYPFKSMRLWSGPNDELTEVAIAWIQDNCKILQGEMHAWLRGGVPHVGGFDGTVRSLILCYQNDKDSPYQKLRYGTREHYDALLRRLGTDCGTELLADIKARNVLRLHEGWTGDGKKVAMGHSMVTMLRTLCGFGMTILEDAECARLSGVLSKMKFAMSKPRSTHLSAEQAQAICDRARADGRPSIALAQAFQFELMLRQRDCIGEWVPQSEPGISDVTNGYEKWLRGLRWSEIDANLILRHTTSKRLKDIEVDLKNAPMVMAELAKIENRPTAGPVIVSEIHQLPYTNTNFRRDWRKIATACGVPPDIRNMDSRAGGISEATDAGVDIEHVRHAATHSNSSTTMRYSRNPAQKTAVVQLKRAAFRSGTKPE